MSKYSYNLYMSKYSYKTVFPWTQGEKRSENICLEHS